MRRTVVARACNQRVTPAGRRVVDLVMRDGSFARGAAVLGGKSLPIHVPLETEVPTDAYQYFPRVLAVADEYTGAYYVVDIVDNPKAIYYKEKPPTNAAGMTDPDDVDDDTTYTLLEEARVDAGTSAVILRREGAAVIAASTLSVQLPTAGYVRLSTSGDTSGRTVLAGPVLDKLQGMVDTINELRQAVLDMQQALLLFAVSPANSTLTAPTGGGPVTGTANILSSPVYTGGAEPDVDDLALTAAVLHMSARTEKD